MVGSVIRARIEDPPAIRARRHQMGMRSQAGAAICARAGAGPRQVITAIRPARRSSMALLPSPKTRPAARILVQRDRARRLRWRPDRVAPEPAVARAGLTTFLVHRLRDGRYDLSSRNRVEIALILGSIRDSTQRARLARQRRCSGLPASYPKALPHLGLFQYAYSRFDGIWLPPFVVR